MSTSLAGKAALVTGGARGIGRAIALRLAAEGADVAVVDVNGPGAAGVAREIIALERRATSVQADVASPDGRRRLLAATLDAFGRLDILVNNAGIVRVKRPQDVTEEEWDEVLNVNCKAVFFTCTAARSHLAATGRGRIINIASVAGKLGTPWWLPYGVSKAGVISLTRSLAASFASDGIRVNCVCPGPVDTTMWTEMNEEAAPRLGLPRGEFTRMRVQNTPLGRLARPEDVAGVVAFLCSSDAEYMTGQAINVSGGLVMH